MKGGAVKFIGVVCLVVVVILGGFALAGLLGAVDVGADTEHAGITRWYLEQVRESSIHGRIDDVEVPVLDEPARIGSGAVSYQEMCAGCHGAPGVKRSVVGEGLNPRPPDLAEMDLSETEDLAEAFWVVKHGIRMTGMPSFGITHTDEDLWDVVAFVGELHGMSASRYEATLSEAGVELEEAGHHAHEAGAHAQSGDHQEGPRPGGAGEHGTHAHDGGGHPQAAAR